MGVQEPEDFLILAENSTPDSPGGSQMKEYHDHEQRLIYKTCPGCSADLEIETEECVFCDHNFRSAQIAVSEPAPLNEPESGGNSFFVMLALNVLVSVVSALGTSMERQQERETSRHRPHLTQEEWEFVAQRFMKHDKTIPAEVGAQMDLEEKSGRVKALSVIFSNNPWVMVRYTKDLFKKREFDPLERFRVPQSEE